MIKVIDSICGKGKTTSMINMMNENPQESYLYITPYIDEVKRVSSLVNNLYEVKDYGNGKRESLEALVSAGCNASATHELFRQCGNDIKELFVAKNYTLILDEVMDVVETLNLSKKDIESILDRYVEVDKDGKVTWTDKEYYGVWNKVKNSAESGQLYYYDNTLFIWLFPVDVFKSFKQVFICTYMYDCQIQKYYYDFYKIKYEKFSVEDGKIIPYKMQYGNTSKIHILDHKINYIGDARTALSKSWYMTNTKDRMRALNKNMNNFRRNIVNCSLKDLLWTTFSDFQGERKVGGKTYNGSFASSNLRATNKHQDRHYVMYLINKFLNPFVKRFFMDRGIAVEEDRYALSELLQFLYRSAIRQGEDIYIYIPSARMRNLLERYINKEI